MSYFTYNLGNIYYEYYETESEKTIVFLHGFSLDNRMWEPQIKHFKVDFNILTYDLRGFGKSSVPTQEYSHHDDLVHLLKYLNIEKAHLVGLSMGGRVAVDFALEHPHKVISLTLLDSSLGGYKSEVDWKINVENYDFEKAKQIWIEHAVFEYSLKNPSTKQILNIMLKDYSGWHWLNKDTFEKAFPDAKERLNEIKAPTVVGVGKYDLEYFHNIAKLIQIKVVNSNYVTIPTAGHMSNLDNYDFVNELIKIQTSG